MICFTTKDHQPEDDGHGEALRPEVIVEEVPPVEVHEVEVIRLSKHAHPREENVSDHEDDHQDGHVGHSVGFMVVFLALHESEFQVHQGPDETGDEVHVTNGKGMIAKVRITSTNHKECCFEIVSNQKRGKAVLSCEHICIHHHV